MLIVYTLSNCDTCRAATKWLRAQGIAFTERAIRETPPTAAELKVALAACGGEVRRLFNTSGREFRAQNLTVKLPSLSEAQALALLAGDGHLVKRPFAVDDRTARVGFKEEEWTEAWLQKKRAAAL